jgi:hypothetical protein
VNANKTWQILGMVVLLSGATFLIVGLSTKMTAMWTIGPAFLVLGMVFLVTASVRAKRASPPSNPSK